MASESLRIGMKGTACIEVETRHLASEVGSGDTHVFATPMLIAGMEDAAVKAVARALEPGLTTVGTHVNVYHRLASPLGAKVTFEAMLEKISPNGKGLGFKVHAWDECGDIGYGTHERIIVRRDIFEQKAQARCATEEEGN